MGLFDFFIRRKPARRRSKGLGITGRRQIAGIHGQIDLINDCLQKHSKNIDENSALLKEHGRLLDDHGAKFVSLEQRLMAATPAPPQMELPLFNRPISATTLPPYPVARQHNIENFSPQEKRILSIFFQNHDMAFSYIDIAKVLGKSANTVKNQMHQLSMKADLFERSIDNQNRNRFKLKDGLKLEQYLNVN